MIKINEKKGKDSEHLRPDETICYCFGYTRKDIEEDFELHGVSKILEGIRKARGAGSCDCVHKNPKGT